MLHCAPFQTAVYAFNCKIMQIINLPKIKNYVHCNFLKFITFALNEHLLQLHFYLRAPKISVNTCGISGACLRLHFRKINVILLYKTERILHKRLLKYLRDFLNGKEANFIACFCHFAVCCWQNIVPAINIFLKTTFISLIN